MGTQALTGRSLPRKEGRGKVTGTCTYVDDMVLPDMLHGITVRSEVARGRILRIEFDASIPWHEYTVVTARDIPGANHVALILNDQPFLADGLINHPEEAVVLLAHPNKEALEAARRKVRIVVDPLPPLFDVDDSLACKEIIWGTDNVFKTIETSQGDVDEILKSAPLVVAGSYETGAQEHLYIEPNGMLATFDQKEGVTVWGSLQCPYYIQKALASLFGLPAEKIRVIQAETGGGFGGKEEYPSMIAGHAALLAYKARRPVKLIYDRAEDLVATTKRHPSRTRHRTAVAPDGRLLAMDIEFLLDGGAYATLSAVVLSRGLIHAAGPYSCPNLRIRGQVVATNTPPHGAFRGFGAPQSVFAVERHMNRVAARVGLAPEELRRRNFVRQGGTTATGQVLRQRVPLPELMDRAFQLADFHSKSAAFAAHNRGNPRLKRGIGFASFLHGAGFTGSGEKAMQSVVAVEATATGQVRVLAASTEIGQGTNTVFSQIAGDALGLPYEMIEIQQPDTKLVPNSGPTVASRTVMIVGKLVEEACLSLKRKLQAESRLAEAYTPAEFRDACARHHASGSPLKAAATYQQPPSINWDDQTYRGDAYADYAWAVYVAEVTVDLDTYDTKVDRFIAVQEIGHVVHPVMAAGQIEGGVAQGIGFALYEQIVWRDGRMANARMTNYIVPTTVDTPDIVTEFLELGSPHGPGRGAKGIGELPLDGTAPAIANAMEAALGVAVDSVPMTPEALMALVEGARHG